MQDRVIILDGLNQIYRADVKFGSTKKSLNKIENTIVYNFLRSLRVLWEQFKPTRCFFVLEGYPKFRYDLFPEYKANRIVKNGSKSENRESFNRQKKIIIDLLQHLPLSTVRANNFEGDDVIYSLISDLKDEEVIIISSDGDFTQILQEYSKYKISLYNPIKNEEVLPPKDYSYLVYKSIAGDVSDNIPAIASKEEARKIASSPVALRAFLSNEENRANFALNRNLITMQIVPGADLEILAGDFNPQKLKEKLGELNVPSLLEDKYWHRFVETFEEKL